MITSLRLPRGVEPSAVPAPTVNAPGKATDPSSMAVGAECAVSHDMEAVDLGIGFNEPRPGVAELEWKASSYVWRDRVDAAEKLSGMEGVRLDLLERLAGDNMEAVATTAILGLGMRRDGLKKLTDICENGTVMRRMFLARSIGMRAFEDGMEIVEALSRDDSSKVRAELARWLVRYDAKDVLDRLAHDLDIVVREAAVGGKRAAELEAYRRHQAQMAVFRIEKGIRAEVAKPVLGLFGDGIRVQGREGAAVAREGIISNQAQFLRISKRNADQDTMLSMVAREAIRLEESGSLTDLWASRRLRMKLQGALGADTASFLKTFGEA